MALQLLDDIIATFDTASLSAADRLVQNILNKNASKWSAVIGDRTSDAMKKETAIKWASNKSESNAVKRLNFVQTLFNQYRNANKSSSSASDEKDDEKDNDNNEAVAPIDDILKITRGSSTFNKESGSYTISSQADLGVDCNFALDNDNKWYFEMELLSDPNQCDSINIGYANNDHSARNEVGLDGNSFGYNMNKNRLFNIDSKYGQTKWKKDDILGFALDLSDSSAKMEFYLNGESQGVAFENVDYSGNLYAALTMQQGQTGVFIYDESKFKQTKPAGYSPVAITADGDGDTADLWEMAGNIKAETDENGNGIKITANQGFPTAVLKKIALAKGGKYYFELELGGGGCMQLGFSDDEFKPNADYGEGVGDDSHSWGFDLLRMQRWGIVGKKYCTNDDDMSYKAGDIIGCLLDNDNKTIEYSVNGKSLGVAFNNININELYPCVSIRNIAARQKLIELYQKKRMKQMMGGADNDNDDDAELKEPDEINYFDLRFEESSFKFKPKTVNAIADNITFKMMKICDSLRNYSYAQYKEDYFYNDTVIHLHADEEFDEIMEQCGGDKLIVIDFYATWCGPCVYIAPHYHEISKQFTNAVFLKVDVDKLKKLSKEKGVECMPTFQFYKNKEQVLKLEGANKDKIIEACKKYSE